MMKTLLLAKEKSSHRNCFSSSSRLLWQPFYLQSQSLTASSSIVVCPLCPKKGDSLSDPSSFSLQKFANLASSNPSPLKHFARIVFRQPLFPSSTPKIFVLRIQLLYSVLSRHFFFQASSRFASSRYIDSGRRRGDVSN